MCTMAEDRGLAMAESHFTDLTCGTENLSPYSGSSSYAESHAYYPQQDYAWQHLQQPQHPNMHHPTHQQMLEPTDKHYYNSYQDSAIVSSADAALSGNCYQTFTSQQHPSEFFSPSSHALWPTTIAPNTLKSDSDISPGSLSAPQLSQQPHRFFSGIDVSQYPSHAHLLPQHPHHQNGPSIVQGANTNVPVMKPKRKRVQSHGQRKAANVRERRRMFHLNEAFDELRKRLPAFNYEKRLSRIETLRLAMTYISFMKDVSVGEDPKSVKLKPHIDDMSSLASSSSSFLSAFFSNGSGSSNDDNSLLRDDSDSEMSNHSGGN